MSSDTSVMHRDVATARPSDTERRDALDGLRVLFLPKNSRADYFTQLIRKTRKDHGWTVFVPCPADAESVWDPVIGDTNTIRIPDFLRPTSVDSNPAERDDIDAFIAACEAQSGISAGRIILAGERDLGRGFARPAYHWFHNAIAKATLDDNMAGFAVLRRMFAFARDTLAKVKPDLVMAGEWADPLCFTFQLAARHMGLACLVNRPSKLWSGRSYWSAEVSMYNEAARALADRLASSGAPVSDHSRARIRDFRASPETLGYVKQNWEADERAISRACWACRFAMPSAGRTVRRRSRPCKWPSAITVSRGRCAGNPGSFGASTRRRCGTCATFSSPFTGSRTGAQLSGTVLEQSAQHCGPALGVAAGWLSVALARASQEYRSTAH
jgi:hypothetical protein